MATSPSLQALRDSRRKAGLCIHCGEAALPSKPGSRHPTLTYCGKHQKAHASSYARASVRALEAGVCPNVGCRNKPEPGRRYCADCNRKSGKRTARRRELRVLSGLCGQCGERPRLADKTRCQQCLDAMNASIDSLYERRLATGQCVRCGENPIGVGRLRLCESCCRTNREHHAKLKRLCLDAYGGPICVGCNETEVAVLQIDHVAGGGHRHALKLGKGNCALGRGRMYRHLRDEGFPPGYRVLCANCNIRAARGLPFPNEHRARVRARVEAARTARR